MSMEKIKKEELPYTPVGAPLSDDELEQVTGGLNWISGNCSNCGAPYSEECNGNNTCKVCGLSLFTWI